jgi:hypothetical protein
MGSALIQIKALPENEIIGVDEEARYLYDFFY